MLLHPDRVVRENLLVPLETHNEPLARVGEVECHRRDAVRIVTAVTKVR